MKDILARNIRRRRQILGLDQGQMADRIGVSRITFSKYENGKAAITDDVFYRLSRIFGCWRVQTDNPYLFSVIRRSIHSRSAPASTR